MVTSYPQSPNRNQQASLHARISQIFSKLVICIRFSSIFPFSYPKFLLNFSPKRDVFYIIRESRKDSLHSLLRHRASFYFSVVLPLVFANPEDLCGSFFFFLNGSSFPSASTLSRTCSSACPPRYCLPEMSFPIELLAVW